MQLPERLSALKRDFEAKAPQNVVEIMHRATEDLRNSDILQHAVKVGDKAPDFSLQDDAGKEIPLRALLAQGPVVLSFYRGRW